MSKIDGLGNKPVSNEINLEHETSNEPANLDRKLDSGKKDSFDIDPKFNIGGKDPLDLDPGFNIGGGKGRDIDPGFNVGGKPGRDIDPGFNIGGKKTPEIDLGRIKPGDIDPGFNIGGKPTRDIDPGFNVGGKPGRDIDPGFNIGGKKTPEIDLGRIKPGDIDPGFNIGGKPTRDIDPGFNVGGKPGRNIDPGFDVGGKQTRNIPTLDQKKADTGLTFQLKHGQLQQSLKISQTADDIFAAAKGIGVDEEAILKNLSGLNDKEKALLKSEFNKKYGVSLDDFLQQELNGADLQKAQGLILDSVELQNLRKMRDQIMQQMQEKMRKKPAILD